MSDISIFVAGYCPHCKEMINKLSSKNLTCNIDIIDVEKNIDKADELGLNEIPVILSEGKEIEFNELLTRCT